MRMKDAAAKARILARLRRIELHEALLGDYTAVGGGVIELRFSVGPGYRVDLALGGQELIILLAGGDKSTQGRDIALAQALAKDWRDGHDR